MRLLVLHSKKGPQPFTNLSTTLGFFVVAWCLLVTSSALAQLGPCADVRGPKLPDLIVDQHLLKAQMQLTKETFGPNSCTVDEECVDGPGTHLLLRFMSSTPNIGQADMVVGNPAQCRNQGLLFFEFHACHQHFHFNEYADYRLWTVAGYDKWVLMRNLSEPTNTGNNSALLEAARNTGELLVGRKQGFCMIDVAPFPFSGIRPGPPVYQSCSSNQGIKVGWTDQYGPQLACQFIQMPNDLPEGLCPGLGNLDTEVGN